MASDAELVEGISLIGDRSYPRDRLQAYAAAGMSVLLLSRTRCKYTTRLQLPPLRLGPHRGQVDNPTRGRLTVCGSTIALSVADWSLRGLGAVAMDSVAGKQIPGDRRGWAVLRCRLCRRRAPSCRRR